MAIAKTIQIHSEKGIRGVCNYIRNPEKTSMGDQDLIRELEYDVNPAKTTFAGQSLVEGYQCRPEHVVFDFSRSRYLYESRHGGQKFSEGKQPIYAIHLVMSFPEVPDLSPLLVHQIGMEFCERLKELGMGDYQAVVSTHVNTRHLHNHILINAYNTDGSRKFADNMTTLRKLRDLNDELSLKYGLPIIEEWDRENNDRRTRYGGTGEKSARMQGKSWKEQFRQDIRSVIRTSENYEDFRSQMESLGYSFRELADGTPISIYDDDHRIRLERLGDEFTYDAIVRGIAQVNGIELTDQEDRESTGRTADDLAQLQPAYISRYTDSGRRRSDLEMLLLKVHAFLQLAADVMKAAEHLAEAERTRSQAVDLKKALELAARYDLNRISDVSAALKDTGRRIASEKREIQALVEALSRLQDAEPGAPSASLLPMTPRQRRELFLAAQGTGVRIHARFDQIDLLQAQEAIDWAKGDRSGPVPEVFRKDFRPRQLTEDQIRSVKQQILEMKSADQQALDSLGSKYKDLKFLQRSARDASEIDAETRAQRRARNAEEQKRREAGKNVNI